MDLLTIDVSTLIKGLVQIHNIGILGSRYILIIMIINVMYD